MSRSRLNCDVLDDIYLTGFIARRPILGPMRKCAVTREPVRARYVCIWYEASLVSQTRSSNGLWGEPCAMDKRLMTYEVLHNILQDEHEAG